MRLIGYSTGALAFGKFQHAIELLAKRPIFALELSALRESELNPLIEAIDSLNLSKYSYISFHAPTKLVELTENDVVKSLSRICGRGWPVIVHPNIIKDYRQWRELNANLCIENMDKRQHFGRTSDELDDIFQRLPEASLCFDIGHARQIDPTMGVAAEILHYHSHRIRQLHVSEVDTQSRHHPITLAGFLAFRKVLDKIPENAPIIIESVVDEASIDREVASIAKAFEYPIVTVFAD